MLKDRDLAFSTQKALADFMSQAGLRLQWLPFSRGAANAGHAGNRPLQHWLRDLTCSKKKRARQDFFRLLGAAIHCDIPHSGGLGGNLARQIAMLFEQADAASGRPRYDWLAELWAQTNKERKMYPRLEEIVDVFLSLADGRRGAFDVTVKGYQRCNLDLVLGWTRRILVGLILFTWAIYSILDYPGSQLSFGTLIMLLAILGSWEIQGLCRQYSLRSRLAVIAAWLSLIAIVTGLRIWAPYVLIFAIYLGSGYDSLAMAFGRLLDPQHRQPILPQLSDRKTVVGTLAGLPGSWLCGYSWWSAWLPDWSLGWALLAILPGPLMAFLGDVLPSVAKKQSGLRHSGESLPQWAQLFGSHGGAVDRALSVLMVAAWIGVLTLIKWWWG